MAATRSSTPPDPAAAVEACLRDSLATGSRLCVALSGGRDSVVLLHLVRAMAARLELRLSAVHVDHRLSPNSAAWADFCRGLCDRLGIPCQVVAVEVERCPGEGLEAAARRARYAAFAALDGDALALAHHAGDQAETLLFRLIRGTGVAGAAGMPQLRTLARPGGMPLQLLRPMLGTSPAAIAGFAAAGKLDYITDESNRDTVHARNFLRHEVLAPVEARFPGAGARLAGAAARFAEADGLLGELAAADLGMSLADAADFSVDRLHALTVARQRNLLHQWLRARGCAVGSESWLEQLRRQVVAARPDAQVAFALDTQVVRLWRNRLYLTDAAPAPAATVPWDGQRAVAWADGEVRMEPAIGNGLAVARLREGRVELRTRAGGERIRPDRLRPRRSLKHWLQESTIPPWQRARLPCLWCASDLVWVAGIGVDADYAAAPGEAAWLPVWRP